MSGHLVIVHGHGDDWGEWLAGPVACWFCGHEWVAVRPASCEVGLECPTCGLLTGYADADDDPGKRQ